MGPGHRSRLTRVSHGDGGHDDGLAAGVHDAATHLALRGEHSARREGRQANQCSEREGTGRYGQKHLLVGRIMWAEHGSWQSSLAHNLYSMTRFLLLLAVLGSPTAVAAQADSARPSALDAVAHLVARLDLERYKATIKGLTQFGDRRQGTDRNRDAVNWIEAQLRSYGCSNVARLKYDYQPQPPNPGARQNRDTSRASGGGRYRGPARPNRRQHRFAEAARPAGARDRCASHHAGAARGGVLHQGRQHHPGEMYIVGAHMDGHGWGEAANDDGSGTALVMELARIFSGQDVRTDRSIRFILWNNEETGLNGSRAYVEQRQALQGSAQEPKWLGMIQHDMMLFDHGMPRADGSLPPEQRPEADVNIEFQASAKFASQAQQLAWAFQAANEKYATDYPASVGSHMTNTDSAPFQDLVAAISLRENERGHPDRGGVGPELAPAHRPLRDLPGQGLPAGTERRANDARGGRRPRWGDDQIVRDIRVATRVSTSQG